MKVVENTEDMRLQLFFDGKPEPEVIKLLKRHGMRWSPRNIAGVAAIIIPIQLFMVWMGWAEFTDEQGDHHVDNQKF